jgi:steroid delta-isomerase
MISEKKMREALQSYIDAFNRSDAEGVVGLFADDASVEDPVGRPAMTGKDKFGPFFKMAISTGATLELVAPIRASHGNAAAMAFDVKLTYQGAYQLIHVIDVMTFNDQGRITSMRAYWGPSDMEALGPPKK